MKKCAAVLLAGMFGIEAVPDINALAGVKLTPDAVEALPRRDGTSPDTVFLGFMRSGATGDYKDYLFHFTDAGRIERSGTNDVEAISAEVAERFKADSQGSVFTNLVIEAYAVTNFQDEAHVHARVHSENQHVKGAEPLHLYLIKTNGVWKIAEWDVDD